MKVTTLMRYDPWSEIGVSTAHIMGRRIQSDHPLDVYWIKDPDGNLGLILRSVDADRFPVKIPSPKGIKLQTAMSGEVNELQMILKDPDASEVFLTLCMDVITYSSRSSTRSDATTSLFRRLQHWQALMAYARSSAMEPNEVRGLIGELYVLGQLSIKMGLEAALQAWVAPDDHPQDFACNDRIIEVKTRLAGSRPGVRISSLHQLEMPQMPLYLIAVELVPDCGADSFTLNQICRKFIEETAVVSTQLRENMEIALFKRGYLYMDDYDADSYRVSGVAAYECRGDFPRITRSEVDSRITEAQYVLDLSLLGQFSVPAASVMT